MNSKNVKSRLRFLENNENITYAFTPDAGGNLSYISNEESKDEMQQQKLILEVHMLHYIILKII